MAHYLWTDGAARLNSWRNTDSWWDTDSWWEAEVSAAELAKGFAAGAVGGLFASWVMNKYQSLSKQLAQKCCSSSSGDAQGERREQHQQQQQPHESPTVKTAEAISHAVAGHQLTQSEKKTAGPLVHYGYGALLGGAYGALAEAAPRATAGSGLAFGAAAWFAGDEVALPLLKLTEPPHKFPLSLHADALMAHFVYGLTTEAVRRGLRHAMNGRPRRNGLRSYIPRQWRTDRWTDKIATAFR
jgi:hypothetical protein